MTKAWLSRAISLTALLQLISFFEFSWMLLLTQHQLGAALSEL